MSRAVEGLKNEALRTALLSAAASPATSGRAYEALAQLLAKSGGLPGVRPNLTLAAAFGAEVAQLSEPQVTKLLDNLAAETAAPDTPRVYLPVAAAFGYAHCLIAGEGGPSRVPAVSAWRGLQLLAADERAHVRTGACAALTALAVTEGSADVLVAQTEAWLDDPEREVSYGAVASALEVLSEPRVISSLREHAALLSLLSRIMQTVADAPRSAQRSDGRRRVLRALPNMLANLVAAARAAAAGSSEWFREACESTRDPELRAVLSDTLQRMAELKNAPARAAIDQLRAALASSQKPIRDAARVRPGTGQGRGRRSRPQR